MLKKILAILTVTMMLFTIGGTVLAQTTVSPGYLELTGEYQFDGDVDWEMHAGSDYTGARHVNIVKGNGVVEKVKTLKMQQGKLTLTQEAILNTHANAAKNLKLISATKVGFASHDDVDTEQIYAVYASPAPGHYTQFAQSVVATHGYSYTDTFYTDLQSKVSSGVAKRFISLGGAVSGTKLVDDLNVEGYSNIKEVLELYDTIETPAAAPKWYLLF